MGSRLIWKSQPRLYVRIFHLFIVFFHSALNHLRQLLEHLPLILIIRIPAQSPNPGPDLDHRINIIQSAAKVLAIFLDQLLGHHTLFCGDLRPCRPSYLLAIPFGLTDALTRPFMQILHLFFRLLKSSSGYAVRQAA